METYGIEKYGIIGPKAVYRNLTPAQLTEAALRRGEGALSKTGALVVTTGKYTGRSPNDKFIVDTEGVHDDIAWGKVNRPISREKFDAIKGKVAAYLQGREVFIFDGYAGADPKYTKKFRVINELASQNMFIHQLLIRPTAEQLANYGEPDYTMLVAPGFKCDPEVDGVNSEAAIMIDYEAHLIVIAGSQYSGEIKKSVFSTMNYVMTKENVLPMHCSANMDPETHETAVFFGLSGTGKTTLSADPGRKLIGDDEHGWSPDGIFNFEGGCYAKCINLKEENEPDIFRAIKFGSLVENVVMDPETRELDFDDDSPDREHPRGLPRGLYLQRPDSRRGRHPQGGHLPDRRRIRRPASHQPSEQGSRHVPLRHRLHFQAGRHRARHHRAPAHLLHPVRRALHAHGSPGVRQDAG